MLSRTQVNEVGGQLRMDLRARGIQKWRTSAENDIIWVSGVGGMGKSGIFPTIPPFS